MNKKSLLTSALLLASLELSAAEAAKTPAADPIGKCFGVVGKGQGECSGKNPTTGETWSCSGGNPTADLGFKEMKESQCKLMAKHKEASKKSFEPYK